MGKHDEEKKEKKEKNKKTKKSKVGNFILNIILVLLVIVFVFALIKILEWYLDNKENQKILEEISSVVKVNQNEEGSNQYAIDFNALKEKNPDTVGWLKVDGTDIQFAVVKTTNNGYYLSRNFNKEYNLGGWIFADYRNKMDGTDRNVIIYGHNMRDNSMFGTLKNVIKPEWYNNEDNYKVTFITENEEAIYEVFSVYQIENEDYYIKTGFKNNTEFEVFINTLKDRSVKDFNVELSPENSILTLSTCANNNQYRVVLHAKKVENYVNL